MSSTVHASSPEQLPAAVADLIAQLAPAAAEAATIENWLDPDRKDPCRLAVASRGDGTFVPDLREVLDILHQSWWMSLDDADKVAVAVRRVERNGKATMSEVLNILHIADDPIPTPYYTTVTTGRVRCDEHGQWVADVGSGGTTTVVGVFGSVDAAELAALESIETDRAELRAGLASLGEPLRRLAQLPWESPTVMVWATTQQRERSDADIVTITEIARRAGVRRPTVDQWRQRHPDFPLVLEGTTVRRWSEVAAWLTATGRLPE